MGTLHLLTLGPHVMTQKKFVTKILLIFHKSSMIPAIPAEWPVYLKMIQKLPMFVSHIHIVVMHLTAVSSYMCQHDILIGFSELNQGLACQVIKAQTVLLLCVDVFKCLQCAYNTLINFITCKCKEIIAVFKLKVATGVSIKSREKAILRVSDRIQVSLI